MDDAKHPGPSCLSQHSSALGTSYPQSRLTLTAAPPTSYAHRRAHAQGRSYRIFRHNVFHHIGHISTLAQPTNRYNPGCYALMYDWLLPAEVFNEKDCPDDDLWPCKEAKDHAPAFFPTPRLQFSAAAMKPLALVPEKARVLQPLSSLPQLPTWHLRGAGWPPPTMRVPVPVLASVLASVLAVLLLTGGARTLEAVHL